MPALTLRSPGGIGGLGLDTRIPLLLVKIVEPVRIPAGA